LGSGAEGLGGGWASSKPLIPLHYSME